MNLLSKNIDEVLAIQCPPKTKAKIMDAAIKCVKAWGIEKTTLNDIAKGAGCTRQTVYKYYKTKDDIIFAALIDSAATFSGNLINCINAYDGPAERILEAIMYSLTQLPNEPYLQLITDEKFSPLINPEVFNSEMCVGIISNCAYECVKGDPELKEQAEEIGESMTRILLSLLSIPGPRARSEEEMRNYIRRRYVYGLASKN